MRTGHVLFVACVAAASIAGCKPIQGGQRGRTTASTRPVAATERPFAAMPTVVIIDNQQTGPTYKVEIVADITRDVMPTDDLAIVVSVADTEVGRYPIVGRFERGPTRIKQEIELPLGDYEIAYDYKGTRFSGMPFRLAEVPVWGGRRSLQLRMHPGTRVSLRERKLWVGRWWANDGPPQAWIIEWVHEGEVITATSGREERGIPANASRVVGGAAGAYASSRVVENTIWAYGEEYPLPDVVASKPGAWAARVVHGDSSPIAVVFTVLPDGRLAEASGHKVHAVGWEESWSRRLEQRALSLTEVDRLTAKLPQISSTQPFDDVDPRTQTGPEQPIRISTAAVRALFRSRALAEAWWQFTSLNVTTAQTATRGTPVDAAAFPQTSVARKPGMPPAKAAAASRQAAREAAKEEAEHRAKLRSLRSQIESLIKQHGGAWKPDEFPRS